LLPRLIIQIVFINDFAHCALFNKSKISVNRKSPTEPVQQAHYC
jgi:hypothetical protein